MSDDRTVIPHMDEIDTSRNGWAANIEKVRKNGQIYTVKQHPYKPKVYFVKND